MSFLAAAYQPRHDARALHAGKRRKNTWTLRSFIYRGEKCNQPAEGQKCTVCSLDDERNFPSGSTNNDPHPPPLRGKFQDSHHLIVHCSRPLLQQPDAVWAPGDELKSIGGCCVNEGDLRTTPPSVSKCKFFFGSHRYITIPMAITSSGHQHRLKLCNLWGLSAQARS